jgi:hypothetical protein
MSRLTDLLNDPPEDGESCWIWPGRLSKDGRPHRQSLPLDLAVRVGAYIISPYRATYILLRGCLIPEGLEIDHLCFTPACVNPWHLEPVTHAENLRRRRGFSRFGSIELLPSRRYRARYRLDGQTHTAPTTFATRAEAKAWLAAING